MPLVDTRLPVWLHHLLASLEGFQPTFTCQLDALLFVSPEAAVETVFGDFSANIAGNWFFIAAMTVIFVRDRSSRDQSALGALTLASMIEERASL